MEQFFPDWKVLDITHQVTVDLSVQLGLGAHSDVYRGMMDSGEDEIPVAVAIKIHRYTREDVSRNGNIGLRIVDEISIWRSLQHPNILPFYGLFLPGDVFSSALPASVSLWCDGGTLLDYLRRVREGDTERPTDPAKNLNLLQTEVTLLLEATRGLAYLHGECITHGDIKSANIFLHDGVALLGDLGYSVQRSQYSVLSTSACLGTARFFAPESIEPRAHRTPEADVWALGCVIIEAHTLREPYSGMGDINMLLGLRKGDLPYSYYPDMNRYLWDLAENCWSRSPDARPSSRDIEHLLAMCETLGSLEELSQLPDLRRSTRTPCRLTPPLRGHAFGVKSVAFLVNGRLVSSSYDKTLRIWDIETGETVGLLEGHTRAVSSAVSCVAAHGSRIASCSWDGTFRVWDADSGKLVLGPITAHTGRIMNWIAYSKNGTRIATAGDDNRAAVWDVNTGAQLREIVGHTDWVYCIAFSEDGTRLVSGSHDDTVRITSVILGTFRLDSC